MRWEWEETKVRQEGEELLVPDPGQQKLFKAEEATVCKVVYVVHFLLIGTIYEPLLLTSKR